MKYRAVIFDLFGTLVDDPPRSDVLAQMAAVLSIEEAELQRLWSETLHQRRTGGFLSIESNIAHICRKLAVNPEICDIKRAAAIGNEFARRVMTAPREGAVATLSELKRRGYKTGLVSDCSPDVPKLWSETPLAPFVDAAVFSCVAGVKKPHRRIYEFAVERLGVATRNCLYVGNGGSDELRGAFELGMHPVLVVPPAGSSEFLFEAPDEVVCLAQEHGDVISSLEEILSIVE